MSIITAILEPDADGVVHLQLPPELRSTRVKVEAKLEAAEPTTRQKAKAGLWKDLPGQFWMADDFDAPLEDFREYME